MRPAACKLRLYACNADPARTADLCMQSKVRRMGLPDGLQEDATAGGVDRKAAGGEPDFSGEDDADNADEEAGEEE